MADASLTVTQAVNNITVSSNDGSYNLLGGGTIGGPLQLNGTLTTGVDDTGYDVKFFGDTSGRYLHWDASADKLILSGDFEVTGTTTTINSTVVTVDDPIFTLGGDTAPSSDDNKDRGIEFRYHDGSSARVGFFGYDDSASAFTFLTAATNSSEVFSGTVGNLNVGNVLFGDGSAGTPSISFSSDTDTGLYYSSNTIYASFAGSAAWLFKGDYIGSSASFAAMIAKAAGSAAAPSYSFMSDTDTGLYRISADKVGISTGGTLRADIDQWGLTLVGQLLGKDGSASSPSVAFSTDSTTGLFKPAADSIGFTCDGTEAGRFNSSGAFSVVAGGTSSPTGVNGLHLMYDSSSATSWIKSEQNGTSNRHLGFHAGSFTFNTGATTFNNAVTVGVDDTGHDVKFFGATAGSYMLWDESQDDLILGGAARLGIGTTAPSHALNVAVSSGDDGIILQKAGSSNDIFRVTMDGTNDQGELYLYDGAVCEFAVRCNANVSYINTPANFGIGNTSPASKLHVTGTVQVGEDDTGHDVKFYGATSGSYMLWDESTDDLILGGASMLGIGTTSPAAKLDIVDSQTQSGSGGIATILTTATTTATSTQSSGMYKIQNNFNLTGTGGSFQNSVHQQVLTTVSSTGTSTYLKNHLSRVHTSGSGQINSVGHYNIQTELEGTGTITNWVGYAVAHPNLTSFTNTGHTITNTYGLYIGDITSGTQTNTPYGVYQASTDMLNYFGSKVGIGTTTPTANLDITSSLNQQHLYVQGALDSGSTALARLKTISNGNVLLLESGTTSDSREIFDVKNSNGSVFKIQGDGVTAVTGNLTVSGDLEIGGTTTTIDTANLLVEDKNIILGNVSSPSDTTADGGGITLKGASDYTINWTNSTDSWHFNQGITVGVDDTGHDVKFFGATSGKYMLWDESADKLTVAGAGRVEGHLDVASTSDFSGMLRAYDKISIGGGSWVDAASTLDVRGTVQVGVDDTGHDVKFFGATSGMYLHWDESANALTGVYDLKISDSREIQLGAGNDLRIYHAHPNNYIVGSQGNLYIQNSADDGDIIFQSDDGSGGLDAYFWIDGSALQTTFVKDLLFYDNVKLNIGTSSDLKIYSDGSNTIIDSYNCANMLFRQHYADGDMTFQCDDGSGGVETYFFLDGSASSGNPITIFPDNSQLRFGSDGVRMYHNGTDSHIQNRVGDLYIYNDANDKDIIFQNDDGSGGTEIYFFLDGSLSGGSPITVFPDEAYLAFGSATDFTIRHTGADTYLSNDTGDLYIRSDANDKDIIFQCDDGSGGMETYFFLDGSEGINKFSKDVYIGINGGGNDLVAYGATSSKYVHWDASNDALRLPDSTPIWIGTGNDLRVYHNATDSHIDNYTGNLNIVNNADDGDINFYCDDGSGSVEVYFYLDGSLSSGNPYTVFPDNSHLTFGNGADCNFAHDGTNTTITNKTGDFRIVNEANDCDIIFKSDDGSGGTETYFYLDGSVSAGNPYTTFPDGSHLTFGTGRDLSILHDGNNSYIWANGTGNLYIDQLTDDADLIFRCDNGSGGETAYLTLDGSSVTIEASKRLNITTGANSTHFGLTGTANRGLTIATAAGAGQNDAAVVYDACDTESSAASSRHIWHLGGVERMMLYNESGVGSLRLKDDVVLSVGNSRDLRLYHDATDSFVDNYVGDLYIRNGANDKDVIFQCDDGSNDMETYFFLDGSASSGAPRTIFPDYSTLNFGASMDLRILHDGSHSYIIGTNDSCDMYIRQDGADRDIIFQCDDGSGGEETYFFLDGSLSSGNPYTIFPDNSFLSIGTGADLQIYHNGSHSLIENATGILYIRNNTNDSRIRFQCDDGAGGLATYFDLEGGQATHDGSATTMLMTKWNDNSRIALGAGFDMQIWHDGTDSIIYNQGGDLYIRQATTDKDLVFQCDDGSGGLATYMSLDGGREVVNFSRGIEYNVTGISNADYTVETGDYIIHYATLATSGKTVTIPSAQCTEGRVLIIKDGANGAAMYNITIATEGSETIDGAATKVISSNYGSVTLYADHLGANWFTI